MPIVPRFNQQIDAQPMPDIKVNTNAPLEAFGGGEAQSQFFNAATKLMRDAKESADKTQVESKITDLNNWSSKWLTDQKEGLPSMTGANAFKAVGKFQEEYRKKHDELYSGLTNREQQADFTKAAMDKKYHIDDSINKYVLDQSVKYEGEIYKNSMEAEKNTLLASILPSSANDTLLSRAKSTLDLTFNKAKARAQSLGYDSEGSDANSNQYAFNVRSDLHGSIVERLIDTGNDKQAEIWLNHFRDQMNPDDTKKIDTLLYKKNEDSEVESRSSDIVSRAGDDYEKLVKYIADQPAKYRDKVETRAKAKFRDQEEIKRRDENSSADDAEQLLRASGGDKSVLPSNIRKKMLDSVKLSNRIDAIADRMKRENVTAKTADDIMKEVAVLDFQAKLDFENQKKEIKRQFEIDKDQAKADYEESKAKAQFDKAQKRIEDKKKEASEKMDRAKVVKFYFDMSQNPAMKKQFLALDFNDPKNMKWLSDSEYKALTTRQRNIRFEKEPKKGGKGGGADGGYKFIRSPSQIADDYKLKFNLSKDEVTAFRDRLESMAKFEMQNKKRKLSEQEMKSLADYLVTENLKYGTKWLGFKEDKSKVDYPFETKTSEELYQIYRNKK